MTGQLIAFVLPSRYFAKPPEFSGSRRQPARHIWGWPEKPVAIMLPRGTQEDPGSEGRGMGRKPTLIRQCLILIVLLPLSLLQTGCVHRRVTVNSYPQGALVKVDGQDIGYTPASFDFTWYGTREVQLLLDGYETHTELVRIDAPWYQKFPLDFVSDNFLGRHVSDQRQFSFQLQPKRTDMSGDVMNRAGSLRSEALHGR